MGGIVGAVVGLTVATLGFAVMRDPMKLAWLAPAAEGYYQRAALDRWQRIPLRLLGMLVSLFGMMIASAAFGALLRIPALRGTSDVLLVEMGMLFFAAWGFGLVQFVVQLVRGESLNWFQQWKRSVVLGPIAVSPAITPAMKKESRIFTVGLCVLVLIAVSAAISRP